MVFSSIALTVAAALIAESNIKLYRQTLAREQTERERAEQERLLRVDAEQARVEAEGNFELAREAVDSMLKEVAVEWMADVPQLEQMRRQLLEQALTFYEDFLRAKTHDARIAYEVGSIYRNVGYVQNLLGDETKAL